MMNVTGAAWQDSKWVFLFIHFTDWGRKRVKTHLCIGAKCVDLS